MAFLDWKDDYRTNVTEQDEQHAKLIELINNLYDAMKAGKSKEIMEQTLENLVDYTGYHFSTEEDLMAKYNYPEIESHKKAHEDLVKQVLDFQEKYNTGKLGLSVDLLNFLNKWLIDHILATDKKLGSFLKLKGVK